MKALARPAILNMTPYSSARDEAAGVVGEIWLDANELPWDDEERTNRYPEPQPAALIEELAGLYGVAPERLLVGRGVDEGIDLLVRTFCEARRDSILICPPTYGMYEVAAATQGAEVKRVPLTEPDYDLDVDAVIRAHTPDVHLVFVCSPNNPTGRAAGQDQVAALCRALKDKALVVVDEAYVEFCPDQSVLSLCGDYSNLVVLRTLSKAWGLAGLRVGSVIADPEVIGLLGKVRAPYPLSRPVVDAVLAALGQPEQAAGRVEALVAERKRLAAALSSMAGVVRVLPSDANFLLVQVEDADLWLRRCQARRIVLRDRRKSAPGAIRISVGTPDQNRALLAALTEEAA